MPPQIHRSDGLVVNLQLNGGRVLSGFRSALFAAAARSGQSVNEFVLRAAAEKLAANGGSFRGLFEPGDVDTQDRAPERFVAELVLALRDAGHSDHDLATTLVAAGVGLARELPNHNAFAAFLAEVGETLLVEPSEQGN